MSSSITLARLSSGIGSLLHHDIFIVLEAYDE